MEAGGIQFEESPGHEQAPFSKVQFQDYESIPPAETDGLCSRRGAEEEQEQAEGKSPDAPE